MTREEMWEEFENQLKREVHTPITIDYGTSIRLAEKGIKEAIARWKPRLEQDLKTNIAEERYKDLQDYLGAPYIYEPILKNRENFKAWLERSVDAVRKLDRLEQKLEELEQGPRWIPVSERLPEKAGRYLAYIINEHESELQYIMTCDYDTNGNRAWWYPDDECSSDNVVAWMPLPKPYKESEE